MNLDFSFLSFDVLSGFVLASGWYPVGTWNRALDTYLRMYHPNPKKGMDAFSVLLGDRELTGLVKFVLKLGSPEFMMKRTNFLWSRYFDQGSFSAEEIAALPCQQRAERHREQERHEQGKIGRAHV